MVNTIVSGYLVLRASSSAESLSDAALSSVRSSLVKAFGLQVSNDEELSKLVHCSVIANNKASLLASSASNFVRVRFTAPDSSFSISSSSSPKPKLVSVVLEDGPQTAAVYYTCGVKPDVAEVTLANNSAAISIFDREKHKCQEVSDAYIRGRLCGHSAQTPLILATKRLLVVGAGGIGCELVKALVLLGFRSIVLVDLDTIDATNLNRQFLFRKRHVGMPKSEVVAEAVGEWYKDWSSFLNSKITAAGRSSGEGLPPIEAYYKSLVSTPLTIKPICGNIKNADGPFDLDFFQSFDLVLNGLDNVSARKHVNRMCMQAGVRLVESGTAGYNGQVQPIVRGKTSCYDCVERPPDQKSFAVCTIHARPTTMVHCVHYAKELYERLFGVNSQQQHQPQQEHTGSEDAASTEGAAGAAAAASDEMQFLADIAASGTLATPEGANALLSLLFVKKIEELLAMKAASTWTNGSPPVPLREAMATLGVMPSSGGEGSKDNENNDNDDAATDAATLVGKEEQIKPADDFKVPSVEEAIALATIAIQEAGMRCICPEGARSGFKKEDPIAVRFVTAMANLRASCFHIARDSLHELTTVAGSIVPAIATTNAIIASCVANIAQLMLSSSSSPTGKDGEENADDNTNNYADATTYPFVYVRKAPQTRRRRVQLSSSSSTTPSTSVLTVRDELLIHSVPPPEPNPKCLICSADAARVISCRLNSELYTLGDFIKIILRDRMSLVAPTLSVGPSIIYEHDEFESLAKQSLSRWVGVGGGGATAFVVGDLFQTVEWTMMVYNEGPEAPFYRSDVMHFCLDGTEATGEEERRLGGRGANLPPPPPVANAQQSGSNNLPSAKAVDTPVVGVLLSSTSVSTSSPTAFIVGAKHDRNGHSISSGCCGEEKETEGVEGDNKERDTVEVAQGTDAKIQEGTPLQQGVSNSNHADVDADDDDDLMVVDGPSNGAKGDKRHKAEPTVVAESNDHTMPTIEAKSTIDTDDDVIEID